MLILFRKQHLRIRAQPRIKPASRKNQYRLMSEVPVSKPIDPYAPIIECERFSINQKQWGHYFVQFA